MSLLCFWLLCCVNVHNVVNMLHENKLYSIVYTVGEAQCDNRWSEFQGSCYFISSGTDSWYGARSWCMDNGGDLTSIQSEEEQLHVHLMVIIRITTT